MPLEIRELVIKATIGQEDNSRNSSGSSSRDQGSDPEDIVKLCVDQVLAILKEREER